MAAQRSAPDPESWRAARDAGDLRPTRLDRELPHPLLHLERRGEKAESAAAWSRRCDRREGGVWGRGVRRRDGREGGESTGEEIFSLALRIQAVLP